MKIFKAAMVLALVASALSLGACAHKDTTSTTTGTMHSSTYSK